MVLLWTIFLLVTFMVCYFLRILLGKMVLKLIFIVEHSLERESSFFFFSKSFKLQKTPESVNLYYRSKKKPSMDTWTSVAQTNKWCPKILHSADAALQFACSNRNVEHEFIFDLWIICIVRLSQWMDNINTFSMLFTNTMWFFSAFQHQNIS